MEYAGARVGDGSESDDSVVDFSGNPADKSRTGRWTAASLILGIELSERICVMGISMNLVTYLTGNLNLPTSKSANIVTNFMGTLHLLSLVAGFMADAKLGRYYTVLLAATVTALGVTLLTVATTLSSMRPPACTSYERHHHQCIKATGRQLALLYAALYTTAAGGGGIKSNVSGFGSDQFDSQDPKEGKSMILFFNRFFFVITLGSVLAVTLLVYVQDNAGRGLGYGASALAMLVAVVVFLCGSRVYRFRKAQGSPLSVIARIVYMALKKWKLPSPAHPSLLKEYDNAKVTHTQKFRWLDKAAVVSSTSSNNSASTVTEVEEVKLVLRILPIWSTCILFWTVYSQMITFSVEQATYMNRNLGSFVVPAASFSVVLFLTILLFTSLSEKLLVPIARRLSHTPQGITSLQRVGVGLVFSMAAMAAAAVVEKRRRDFAVHQNVRLSAFWLVPQFFLVGAGKAFAYVGQLEFFIREAPERMKSMSTGLFLSTLGMGFFVSSLLVSLVGKATHDGWIKNNLNGGRLDYFYWMLAVLGVLNFLLFLVQAKKHDYKKQIHVAEDDTVENGVQGSSYVEEEMIKIENI